MTSSLINEIILSIENETKNLHINIDELLNKQIQILWVIHINNLKSTNFHNEIFKKSIKDLDECIDKVTQIKISINEIYNLLS